MPHSVDEEAEERAERLEREARDAISEFRLESERAAARRSQSARPPKASASRSDLGPVTLDSCAAPEIPA